MKVTSYVHSLHDLNIFKDSGLSEAIIGHRNFSRFGKLSSEEFLILSRRARELGMRVIFEWDILMTENTFTQVIKELPPLLAEVDALRVQDPGALEWSFKNTDKPLQFIAENGNHNLPALEGWIDHVQGRMERIVLSIELPKASLAEYLNKLTVPCELLGLGRILLFYTPRSLLSPLGGERLAQNEEIQALGESEESPHKGFPVVENRHGTFMFHIKEFCLLEFARELKEMGLAFLRLDLRWDSMSRLTEIKKIIDNFDGLLFENFKHDYPQDLMRGFYLVNKTDVLFPKLKNHRLQKREGNYIGEILEVEKGSHMAIFIKNPKGLKKGDVLKIVHPKGTEFEVPVYTLRDVALEEVEHVPAQKIALVQYLGGVWVKSHVFYAES
jgi:U32 family peptidase